MAEHAVTATAGGAPACSLSYHPGPCTTPLATHVVVSRTADRSKVLSTQPACFRHGLEHAERAARARSIAQVDLEDAPR